MLNVFIDLSVLVGVFPGHHPAFALSEASAGGHSFCGPI
jgi:hypothetical protein